MDEFDVLFVKDKVARAEQAAELLELKPKVLIEYCCSPQSQLGEVGRSQGVEVITTD